MLSSILASFLFAAIPVEWSVDTFRVKPFVYDCYHGETLDLAASMTAYGSPLDLAGKTARLYWSTNANAAAWWVTNAVVATDPQRSVGYTNILAATFSGAYDTGADFTYGFIGVDGENYRAAFTLRFRPSPGFSPNRLNPPVTVLDFAATTVLNPESSPFVVKGGSGGVTLAQVTNVAENVTSNIVPAWARSETPPESMTDNAVVLTNGALRTKGGSGINYATTNAVREIVSGDGYVIGGSAAWTNGVAAVVTNDVTVMSGFTPWILGNVFVDGLMVLTNTGVKFEKPVPEASPIWFLHLVGTNPIGEYVDNWVCTYDVNTNAVELYQEVFPITGPVTTRSILYKGENALGLAYEREVMALATATNNLTSQVSNKADKATTLSGYGITDAYTKGEVDGTAVTNLGAVVASTNMTASIVTNNVYEYGEWGPLPQTNETSTSYGVCTLTNIFWFGGRWVGYVAYRSSSGWGRFQVYGSTDFSSTSETFSHTRSTATFAVTRAKKPVNALGLAYWSDTTNVISAATNAISAASLKGAVYDFNHGTNFTLRLYETLTNIIDRMGGSVTNAPTFDTED